MLLTTVLALWFVMLRYIDTQIGVMLRHFLVDLPADWLARVTRGHVVIAILFFAVTAVTLWLIGNEAFRVVGMAAPDTMIWLTSVELTSYVDAVAATVLALSAMRLRTLRLLLSAVMPRSLRRLGYRTVRSRKARRIRKNADNDNDEPGLIWLVA